MYWTLCAICGPAANPGVDHVVRTGMAAHKAFLAEGRQYGKVWERVLKISTGDVVV